jgi:N-acetylmuramoyl-L-alanine amidase
LLATVANLTKIALALAVSISRPLGRAALLSLLLVCAIVETASADTWVAAVRVWTAPDYTRVTIESQKEIDYKVFSLANPDRLVVDLYDTPLGLQLKQLPSRIAPNDSFVSGARVGQYKAGVTRIVFELAQKVSPQIFKLKPIREYGHRLVVDIYPTVPIDPILALIQSNGVKKNPRTKTSKRTPVPPASVVLIPKDVVTIALDAGHGGEDPGATGRRGTYEKDVTLAIAKKLKALIDADPKMRAVMIRDGDYYIKLSKRVKKARDARADLFVSIHADASRKSHARGSSVFALSERGATSAAAGWLAAKENEADLIGGVNIDVDDAILKRVLIDMTQTNTISESLKLAKAVLGELGTINKLHKSNVEQAGFAVLKAPDIPSILIETAFLTNPQEERNLRNKKYQRKVAQSILNGIRKYFEDNPPLVRGKLALHY